MNPIFAHLRADLRAEFPAGHPSLASLHHASQHIAIAYDRDYIAAHARQFDTNPDLVAYDRNPLPNEWLEFVPAGAFVRVFVINEWTTVRVLHLATGQRTGEPVIDTWRGTEPLIVD